MTKIIRIVWKDLIVISRDRAALLLMLLAPFALTVGMGLVTGSFGEQKNEGIETIPIVIINQDQGILGQSLLQTLTSASLSDLVKTTVSDNINSARQQVDDDEVAAAVIIPTDFSATILPDPNTGQTVANSTPVEIYANPTRPIGASIIRAIVAEFMSEVDGELISVQVAVTQLIENKLITPEEAAEVTLAIQQNTNVATNTTFITLKDNNQATELNLLAFLAPGMAIFFLMYTAFQGGTSVLLELEAGTLARILTTPTNTAQILSGKIISIFLMGLIQVGILIIASAVLFNLNWGSPVVVAALIVAVVAASTGWGMLLAAVLKSSNQVVAVGSAMMLLFGILGGNFIAISFTGVMAFISHLTPNAWAMDGFTLLARGAAPIDIVPIVGYLLLMAFTLFAISTILFSRRSWA